MPRLTLLPATAPAVALIAAAAAPAAARAHTGERGFVLLMPTEYYVAGGATAVLLSFLVLAALPARWLEGVFAWRAVWRRPALAIAGVTVGDAVRALAFPVFAALVAIGFHGPSDPTWNLLPLTIWTLWWVGFTLLVALLGDLWRFANPWSGPVRLLRGLTGATPPLRLPEHLGVWPAVIGFFAFVWTEIVSLAPYDPGGLATLAALYWAGNFIACLLFGEAAWLGRGEAFSVFFRLIGLLAPAWTTPDPEREGGAVTTLAAPGARLLERDAARGAPVSSAALILLAMAALTFDGFVETFTWIAYLGLNPLEFTGRSAVVWPNSVGLIVAWMLIAGATWTALSLGLRMVGRRELAGRLFGVLALAMTPIALGYHFGHFLTTLLVQGQHALAALSTPFGARGWPQDWLGLGEYYVTTSFLYDAERVPVIWRAQAAGVAIGHLASVGLAHAAAHRMLGAGPLTTLAQAPFAILMALLTLFSLWLLASPTA